MEYILPLKWKEAFREDELTEHLEQFPNGLR